MNDPTKMTQSQRRDLINAITHEAIDNATEQEKIDLLKEYSLTELRQLSDAKLIELSRKEEVQIYERDGSLFPPDDLVIVEAPLEMPICPDCGSHDVTFDALVAWDVKGQCYETTGTVYDNGYCNACDNTDIRPKYIPVIECDCKGTQETCEQCAGSGFKPVEVQS